jgi:Nitrate and nitrite sensing/HAMP domain
MLGNVPIRSKLVVTLIGPLLVLGVLALVGIRSNQAESARAARSNAYARLAAGLAPLVHELQGERSLSLAYIDSRRDRWGPQLTEQRLTVDRAAAEYRAEAERLKGDDRELAEKIQYGLSELGRLPEQREAIDQAAIKPSELAVEPGLEQHEEEGEHDIGAATAHGHGPLDTPGAALDQYTDTINDLLDINTEIAPGSEDEGLLKAVAASVALSRAKDFSDLQRGLLENVFAAGRFGPNEYGKLTSLVAAEQVYDAQFDNAATPEQRELLERTVAGAEVERATKMVEDALRGAGKAKLDADAPVWFAATTVKQDRLRAVEERLSADVINISAALREAADRRALLSSLLLAGTLVLAVVLALVTARSLIRPLGRLEQAAVGTAERLPGVVQRLEDGEQVDLAAESAPPVEVRSRDEIGRLGQAFNTVHRVAVQEAGREASLRRSVGEMFLNLARRSQSLIERQLEIIDEVERGDSDVRTGIAELDHLATRMRRNAENLIILSGSEPVRRWRGPIALNEVVRAAVGEVKEHTRVEVMPLGQVQIAGHAAADVMHLLAELIENAVAFSAPGTQALVAGQPIPAGYLLEIEDQGLGMSDEQLVKVNEQLAGPPDADFALAKMLGFFVVTQLAAKHGIRVQLRHSWYGGITALVLLPADLLLRADAEMPSWAGEPPRAGRRSPPPALGDDPSMEWVDNRVPMIHVPLRRPPERPPGGAPGQRS